MLRITAVREGETALTVQLCGQFTSEYVKEVEDAIAEGGTNTRVQLDLSRVTLVDRPAMVFLCAASGKNVTIANIPSYVTRWMEQERICGPSASRSRKPPQEG